MKVIEEIVRHLRQRGRLTHQDLSYLRTEGFIRTNDSDVDLDNFLQDFDLLTLEPLIDDGDYGEQALSLPRAGGRKSAPARYKGALTARQICAQIAERQPEWAETLTPLVTLARRLEAAATPQTAPVLLRQAKSETLLEAMAEQMRADPVWFSDIWGALRFEGYRACGGPSGNAANAYRAILTGRSQEEINKYAWLLRSPEIAWVYALIVAQRHILQACDALYTERFALVDAHLTRLYRTEAFWPYVLLHSAHRYAAHGADITRLPHECFLPKDALPEMHDFAAFWAFALEMNRPLTLPYMAHATDCPDVSQAQTVQGINWKIYCPTTWYKPY